MLRLRGRGRQSRLLPDGRRAAAPDHHPRAPRGLAGGHARHRRSRRRHRARHLPGRARRPSARRPPPPHRALRRVPARGRATARRARRHPRAAGPLHQRDRRRHARGPRPRALDLVLSPAELPRRGPPRARQLGPSRGEWRPAARHPRHGQPADGERAALQPRRGAHAGGGHPLLHASLRARRVPRGRPRLPRAGQARGLRRALGRSHRDRAGGHRRASRCWPRWSEAGSPTIAWDWADPAWSGPCPTSRWRAITRTAFSVPCPRCRRPRRATAARGSKPSRPLRDGRSAGSRTAPRQDASALPLARRPRPPPGGAGRRRGPDRPGPARLPPHDVDQGAGRRRVRLLAPGRNVLRTRSRGPARHRLGRADGQPAGDGLCHGAAGQSSAGPAPAHHASRRRQPPVQRPAGGDGRGRGPRGAARDARGRVLAAPHAPPAQLGAEPRARPSHRRRHQLHPDASAARRSPSPHRVTRARPRTVTGTSTRSRARAPTSTPRRARPTRRPARGSSAATARCARRLPKRSRVRCYGRSSAGRR